MKKEHSLQIRVGIFVAIGLSLVMLTIFFLSDTSGWLQKHYQLRAYFENISGLRNGASVYLAGVNVGKVKSIEFPKTVSDKRVRVNLEINHKFKDRIRADSKASVVTQGLLGDKVIIITVGSPEEKILIDGDEIAIKIGFSVETLAEKGTDILENVNDLASNVNKLIVDARDNKESILYAILYDTKGKRLISDIRSIVYNTKQVIAQLRRGDRLERTVANFEGLSENLRGVSAKIERGEGSIGGLVNDPTVYYNLMTLLGNANRSKLLRAVIRSTLAKNEKDLTGE